LIATFLLNFFVAVTVADDGCQMGNIRGVVDDIHLLVREEMSTTLEVGEIRTILRNHISSISTTLDIQKTEISAIKFQMSKIMSILQELQKPACTPTAVVPTTACSVSAAGIGDSAIIEDRQLTASSSYDSPYGAQKGRIQSTTDPFWLMSTPYRVGEWLQVDLENNRRIYGVATQGYRLGGTYVKSYQIAFKKDEQLSFEKYKDDKGNVKVFDGNVNDHAVLKNNFDEAFTARYVRIFPVRWHGNPALRWEVYIC